MPTDPIHPIQKLADTYRIEKDASGERFIRHKFGVLLCESKERFVVILTDNHPRITARLLDLGGTMRAWGLADKEISFPWSQVEEVAEVVVLKKKRFVSDKILAHLKRIGIQKRDIGRKSD